MALTTLYGGSPSTRIIGNAAAVQETLHPQVLNYITKLSANGYNPSLTEINAVNVLIKKFVANGIYDKFQVIYPVIGNSGTTSTLDLKDLCNGIANGSWTFDSNGMKPTTLSAANYINTQYNPFVRASQNDAHLSVYVRQSQNAIRKVIGNESGANFLQINASVSPTGNVVMYSTAAATSVSITDSRGLWLGNRTASNAQQLYFNGRLNASSTAASVALSNFNRNCFLGATNSSGSVGFPSDQGIAFASFGTSLTGIEAAIMYSAIQEFQTKLGRQV